MLDKNWARWIFASVTKHFRDKYVEQSIENYIEGEDRDTATLKNYLEIRVDGPYYSEQNKDYWRLYIEVNVLVSTKKSQNNFHTHYRNCGLAAIAFENSIPVYKYGNGPDDDSEILLGCLQLIVDDKEAIITSNFGQLDPEIPMLQSTVEAHYEMFLNS